MNIRALQARLAQLKGDATAILNAAIEADRALTAEEQQRYDALKAKMELTQGQLAEATALAAIEAAAPAVAAAPGNGSAPHITLGQDRRELDRTHGFKALGEFVRAVYGASMDPSHTDPRLAGAATTYGADAVGADGGFLVPPQFSSDIYNLSLTEDALLPLTDNTPVEGNSMVFPKDETTPWGTDGVRAYWQAEASAATATKPKFGFQTMRLHKLMALVPMTDELLADSSAAGSYIAPLMARSIRWKTNEALLLGTGAGQPMGMLINPSTTNYPAITHAKKSGQSASTVVPENITGMIARLPPGAYGDALWLVTPDAFSAIANLTLGNQPLWLPSNQGIQGGSIYGMLMGRPMVLSQHVAAFSSKGDISLIAPSWYRTITKAGGIETATSMHLYFDADTTAFRATFRVDGGPKLQNPISQAKGSNTLSPFVVLENR